MDTSTKAIADHIAGLRAMSHGMGDYDADAMQALLDDRDDWVKAANLALQEKLAAEAERNALRQQLHDARDKALEEAAESAGIKFQDIGEGYRPKMAADALIRDIDGYSKCMPSPHRAQNVMAQAAKLLRALKGTKQ